jgi:tRNA pseudouridine55 synthase
LQFLREDKAYRATIRLGIRTTTDDLEGETIATQPVTQLDLEEVKTVLQQFVGKIQQIPPNYSAIQVQGKRLYDLARAGEAIDVPARLVEVYKIEILDWRFGEFPELEVAIACGSGTYIRAIARDLGTILNTGGVLASLTRTQSCGFHLADSLTFDELEQQLQQESFHPIPPVTALTHLASVTLSATDAKRWCLGQRVAYTHIPVDVKTNALQIHHEDGRFLGIAHLADSDTGKLLIPQMVFEPNL